MVRRSITAQFALTFSLVSVVVIAGFALMIAAVRSFQSDRSRDSRATDTLITADRLEQSAIDLQTGVRGYLRTGQKRFLQPYTAALATYPGLASSLESETTEDRHEHMLAISIASSIRSCVNGWAAPTVALASHDLAAARRAEARRGGTARVDAIRADFARLRNDETSTQHSQDSAASSLAALATVIGLVAIGIFVLIVALVAYRTHTGVVVPLRRLALAGARILRGDLSTRTPPGGLAEVGQLVGGFNRMAEGLERQRDDLEDSQGELEKQKRELEAQKNELEAQQVELESALKRLGERNDYIELVRRFGDRLAVEATVDGVADAALQSIADAAECQVGAAYLLDPDSGAYGLVASRGLDPAVLARVVVPGTGIAGRALAERRSLRVSYADSTLRLPGLVNARDAAHELHLPISHGEHTIGVISLGRAHDAAFSDDEVRLFGDLTERAAVDCAQALVMRRLRHTANSLSAVLESTDEGIYAVGLDGRATLINRAALEQTGYTREEVLGQVVHELMHHSRPDGTPYPHDECPVSISCRTGEGARITDEVYWRKDGSSFPVEYSTFPLFEGEQITGAVVTFLDVSARQHLERQRNAQHALSRVLAEGLPLAEARPRMLTSVCEALEFVVGLTWEPSEEDGVLRPVATYAAPGYEDALERLHGDHLEAAGTLPGLVLSRREPIVCDLVREPPRPEYIDWRLQDAIGLPVLGLGGDVVAVAEFFSAEPVEQEGLVETLNAIARQVAHYVERQRAEAETQRIKDQFVANVSHELRTPLTAIDGWVHILLGEEPGPLSDDQRRFLETVKRNSDRLMRLVSDLLAAGQMEAGKLSLELADVDVSEIARETAELLRAAAENKHLRLSARADEPLVIRGDRQRLAQLLSNLVANAIKFTPEGGSVEISVERDGDSCRMSVVDTGIGIPPAERAHLFERFYRASSAAEHGIGGTGLGLAISKAIAESHHGTIEVADRDGPGTVFVVELPLAIREEALT